MWKLNQELYNDIGYGHEKICSEIIEEPLIRYFLKTHYPFDFSDFYIMIQPNVDVFMRSINFDN